MLSLPGYTSTPTPLQRAASRRLWTILLKRTGECHIRRHRRCTEGDVSKDGRPLPAGSEARFVLVETAFAVRLVEAKYKSNVAKSVTYDSTREQIIRNLDACVDD